MSVAGAFNDRKAKLLDSFYLSQHEQDCTREHGHILDCIDFVNN